MVTLRGSKWWYLKCNNIEKEAIHENGSYGMNNSWRQDNIGKVKVKEAVMALGGSMHVTILKHNKLTLKWRTEKDDKRKGEVKMYIFILLIWNLWKRYTKKLSHFKMAVFRKKFAFLKSLLILGKKYLFINH